MKNSHPYYLRKKENQTSFIRPFFSDLVLARKVKKNAQGVIRGEICYMMKDNKKILLRWHEKEKLNRKF